MPEGAAFHEFHDEEGTAALFTDVVNGADIRMIESGSGVGFTAKTLEHGWITGEIFRKEFDGNKTLQASVFGLVNNAHAATAESFQDAVMRKSSAYERIGAWHGVHIRLAREGKSTNARVHTQQVGEPIVNS